VRSRRANAFLLTVFVSGCAARSFAPPTPSATPAPEGERLWRQAMAPCAAMTSVTAEAALSGRVGGARASPAMMKIGAPNGATPSSRK